MKTLFRFCLPIHSRIWRELDTKWAKFWFTYIAITGYIGGVWLSFKITPKFNEWVNQKVNDYVWNGIVKNIDDLPEPVVEEREPHSSDYIMCPDCKGASKHDLQTYCSNCKCAGVIPVIQS